MTAVLELLRSGVNSAGEIRGNRSPLIFILVDQGPFLLIVARDLGFVKYYPRPR
jgi:hypothetical protein